MKRLMTLVLAVVLVLSMAVTVFADILWIPENPFLEQHMEKCERNDRSYRAITEVKVYQSPEDDKVLWTIPEGEAWLIYYTYRDPNGNEWGLVENWENEKSGWIALAYTELVYDFLSFEEDFGHLFETPDDWVYLDETYAGLEIWFWDYPGSESGFTFAVGTDNMPAFDRLYTDELGKVWGYVGYHMGIRNKWVCLTDATADYNTLNPAGPTPEVSVTQPDETEPTLPAEEIKPAPRPFPMGLTAAVIGCVCITAVLLIRRKKKSK